MNESPVSPKDSRISDQIRVIKAKSDTTQAVMLLQAITRALIALIVIATGSYLLIAQIPVPDPALKVALLVLGAYFGSEAAYKFLSRNSN
jgi:hypothetical protein